MKRKKQINLENYYNSLLELTQLTLELCSLPRKNEINANNVIYNLENLMKENRLNTSDVIESLDMDTIKQWVCYHFDVDDVYDNDDIIEYAKWNIDVEDIYEDECILDYVKYKWNVYDLANIEWRED